MKNDKMNLSRIFALLISFFPLQAEEDFWFEGAENYKKSCIFVSLGAQCWPAQALRLAGLRDVAYPFDWLDTTNLDGFIRMLDENFLHFLDLDAFSPANHPTYDRTSVQNYYGFIFSHDWPVEGCPAAPYRFADHLKGISKKYERRIKRFLDLQSYEGTVFFLRIIKCTQEEYPEWIAQKAFELKRSLSHVFPKLNFTLVVITCWDPCIPETDKIMEFKIDNLSNLRDYQPVFQSLLKLLKS